MNISFPTEEEKAQAQAIAKARKKTVSQMVQEYFRRLPRK